MPILDFSRILDFLYFIRESAGAWLEPNLWWLQGASIILSAFILWGIVYIIAETNYVAMKVEKYINVLGADYLPKHRAIKGWRQILKRLASEEPQQWKIAVLEADRILDEILKMSGYLGSMDEKLELLTPAQLSNIEEVKIAHKIRDQISSDPVFEFSREAVRNAIEIYRKAFVELSLISE